MIIILELYKYSEKEIDKIINSIVILIDTREKVNDHIIDYLNKANIPWKSMKLDYGDYSFYVPQNEDLDIPRDLYFDKEIIIERKASLDEIIGNFTKRRSDFKEEMSLAPKTKVILLENCTYADLINGNYMSKYNQKSFWGSLHSFWHRYGVPFFFIDKKMSGFFIRGFFQYYLRSKIK